MTMIERLKADQLLARKNKNSTKVTLLSTLIGEAVKVGKDNGNRDTTDAETISVIKKFKKNVEDTQILLYGSNGRELVYTDLDYERDLYNQYLPKQLSEVDLKYEISTFILTNECNVTMKDVMSYLKTNYAGLYDGKLASQIANKILTK